MLCRSNELSPDILSQVCTSVVCDLNVYQSYFASCFKRKVLKLGHAARLRNEVKNDLLIKVSVQTRTAPAALLIRCWIRS